jgi:uncharacterized protein with von Willebrand factor type A (vWA) domain
MDVVLSQVAAKKLCDQWDAYEVKLPKPKPNDPKPGSEKESIRAQIARLRSTGAALKEAKEEVESVKDASAGLGMGQEGKSLSQGDVARYFKRVRKSSNLRRIMAWAGSGRRLCRSLQMRKTNAQRGEITGIEMGGDIDRLVPYEMMQVAGAVPELEMLSLLRLTQRHSLCYRHRKNDPMRMGPIVVTVDESGSMSGEKIIAAKGIALTLAWLAQKQKRWIALVGFSGGSTGTRLALPPGHKKQAELMDWLEHFYGGGTTLDVPIHELPFNYWPKFVNEGMQRGKTDVIMITDAIVHCSPTMRDQFKAWASQEHAKTYGIIIGGSSAGDLDQLCDKWWTVPDVSLDSPAVETILSI